MKFPSPVSRILARLKASATRIQFTEPPGVGRVDAWIVAVLIPVGLLTFLLFAAPLMLPAGSTGDLSGRVGVVDNARVWSTFPEPARWTYFVGDIECHTKAARSFTLNGNQMPVCARDVAIFLGMTVGLALAVSPRSRFYRLGVTLPWWGYFALLVPVAVDGGAQDGLGFESDNLRRVLSGFPAGLAVALAIIFIVYEGRFAAARWRSARAKKRGARTDSRQVDVASPSSISTGSLGSKLVDSAPIERKKMLHP